MNTEFSLTGILKKGFIICALFFHFLGITQNQQPVYKELNTSYGLPTNYIYSIEFDNDGFLWMACPMGLVRYDGSNFRTYTKGAFDSGRREMNIKNLCLIDDNIWYTSQDGGLFYYNRLNHNNSEFPLNGFEQGKLGKNPFLFLFRDSENQLWISIKHKGVIRINPLTGEQRQFQHQSGQRNGLISNNVSAMCQDQSGNYWLATDKGINVLDKANGTFHYYINSSSEKNLLLSNNIKSILIDPAGYVWTGTAGEGLSKFDPTTLKRVDYLSEKGNSKTISNNYISNLFVDSSNQLWVSTKNGLNCINLNSKKQEAIRYKKGRFGGLSSNRINDVAISPGGNIWVATNGGGINVIQNSESRFVNKNFNTNQDKLNGIAIVGIAQDHQNRIWIATQGEGVMVFNDKGKYLKKLTSSLTKVSKKGDCNITNLHYEENNMYLGSSSNGLAYIELADERINDEEEVKICTLPQLRNGVYDILPVKDDKTWVLTEKGAYCFNNGKAIDSLITTVAATCIVQDYRSGIWVGTASDGVWNYQPQQQESIHYTHTFTDTSSIVGDCVSCLFEDNTGILWIGTTDGGLCYFDRNYHKFIPFKHADKNVSNGVFSIIEDDDENLWVSSEYGLLKINHLANESVLYGYGEGLLRSEFNSQAVLKDKNGCLFFGTENGLLSFNPKRLHRDKVFPKIKITDFFVFNKSIFEMDDLKKSQDFLNNTKVSLETKENFIGIEFVGADLDYSEHIQYKYRLLGLEDEWVISRSNNYVSYLNIPSGNYTFQLTSTNKDGIWNPEIKELSIEVKTPLFLRTWFVVLSVIFISFIVTILVFLRVKMASKMTLELEEKVNKKTSQLKDFNEKLQREVDERKLAEESAENANKTKSLFLANMSHEIRTPMNSIIGFADLLTSLIKDEKQRNYLESIKSSGRSLLILINDILDLSKIEAGKFEIEYQPVNLKSLVEEIRQVFTLKCDEKDLLFHTDIDPQIPDALMLSDSRLRQIFVNIVGNAIKFTERGSITIKVAQIAAPINTSKINLEIDIIDTGVGIPDEQQQNIFHAFHQQEGQEFNKYGGTGLGLTISKRLMELMGGKIKLSSIVDKGTTFSLYLNDVPVSTEDIKEEQILDITLLNDINLSESSILVVDDSKANRNLIIEFLSPTGATIYEAGNGQEAFDKAKELLPSIIFLDIRMPVMNGLETAKALRNYLSTAQIPLVAFTASISYSKTNKYEVAGFDDVLLKPVQMDELSNVITKHLNVLPTITDKEKDILEDVNDTGFENIRIVDLKAALDDLVHLESEWEFAKSNRFVNVVLEFSIKMIDIGESYSVNAITKYGQQLQLNARSFDTIKMEKSLNAFPQLVDELRSYLND